MRIVVFTSNSKAIGAGLGMLAEERKKDIKAIVVITQLKGGILKKLRSFFIYLKKTSFLFIIYKLYDGMFCNAVRNTASKNKIAIIKTNDINSNEFVEKLRLLNPDISLSFFTQQIFKKEAISIPELGTLNVHGSLLPRYKGAAQYFWYLYNNDKEGGVTVHYMDEGLDTGDIVVQEWFRINKNDTMISVHKKIAETGAKAALSALSLIERKKIRRIRQKKVKGQYLTLPTGREMKEFRKRGFRIF